MNTNTIVNWINGAQGYINVIKSAPAWFQTGLLLVIGCYLWMRAPRNWTVWRVSVSFPNEALWVIVPVAGIMLNMYLAPDAPINEAAKLARRHNAAGGFIVGFLVMVTFPFVVKYVFPRVPYIGSLLTIPDQTPAPEVKTTRDTSFWKRNNPTPIAPAEPIIPMPPQVVVPISTPTVAPLTNDPQKTETKPII